jgi:hypothetical protein
MKAKDEALKMGAALRVEAQTARAIAKQQRQDARGQWKEERAKRKREADQARADALYKISPIVDGFSGVLRSEDETVPNPDESYRSPGKVNVDDLLDSAGLNYTKVITVTPTNGHDTTPEETVAQRSLVDKLNSTQKKYLFVLEEPPSELPMVIARKPGFLARLFGWFRRKVLRHDP